LPCDIVDEESTDRTTVVGAGDGPEILLPSSIPYFEFDCLVFDLNGLRTELDSNRNIVGGPCLVFNELKYDARFAHSYMNTSIPVSPITINLNM
jgi:hypothetical protein